MPSPRAAFEFARTNVSFVRREWQDVKVAIRIRAGVRVRVRVRVAVREWRAVKVAVM